MDNISTLDNLLQIETQAVALVNDAQAEADRRIRESEAKNHSVYEESFRAKIQELEISLKEEKEKIKKRYQDELDEYRKEISMVDADYDRFSSLLNNYLTSKTGRDNA